MHAETLQSCPTLCNSTDCSPPGSSVPEILQARILEWVAMFSSRGSSQPRNRTHISYVSCTGRQVLYHWHHLIHALKSESLLSSLITLVLDVSHLPWPRESSHQGC